MAEIEIISLCGEYAPATEEQTHAFRTLGLSEAKKCEGKKHPYIYANDEIFAKIRALYGRDAELTKCADAIIRRADGIIANEKYAMTEDGLGLVRPIVNENPNEGYDVGGRLSPESILSCALTLALAYQITERSVYARLAYLISSDMVKWQHWGPGHFLNCAQASYNISVAYDWLYNAWRDMGFNVGEIRKGIYRKGIVQGYNSIIFDTCDHPSPKQGTGWRFKLKPDNWNAVCNGGMIISALALFPDKSVTDEEQFDKTATVFGGALTSLMQKELVLKQYVPDGSYVESNSYWSYGTNVLFNALGALYTCIGTDYGIHESQGLDKTCYYAINTESADYVGWNYHDGSLAAQDTTSFNLFATISGDALLYAIRREHIKRGKHTGIYDVLFNPSVLGVEVPVLEGLPLDYHMVGIDGFTVRSGWEIGSLFAAIHGGYNPTGSSHNQLDSGAFVYHNGGKMWFTDLGSDYYNVKNYFSNYALYRRNAEGNNTLAITSLPYGQMLDASGCITKLRANSDDCSYAVIDNSRIYGESVSSAYRGMLLTNERRTTVIQDEVDFTTPTTAYWIAHFESDKIKTRICCEGKRCVMTHEDGTELTVTLLGDGCFEVLDCYGFLLEGSADFEGEYSRDSYSRLTVRFEAATTIRCAVVMELSGDVGGYTQLIPISEW